MEAACRVFWTKGYDDTTTDDLCEATGLGRSSVYNTFESKGHLFVRALEHYVDTMTARQVDVLQEGRLDALARIRRLLEIIIDGEMENRRAGYGSGCFLVNTITALATRDPRVAAIVDKDRERRLVSLRAAIAEGKRDGSITSSADSSGLAWYLMSVVYGMRVSAQSGADEAVLRQIAVTGLVALG